MLLFELSAEYGRECYLSKRKKVAEGFGQACTGEVVHVGEYVCQRGWRIEDVIHPFDGLFYVVSGRARVELDGRAHIARPRDLFFMLRGQRVRVEMERCRRMRTLSTGFRLDVAGAMSLTAWRTVPDKVSLDGEDAKRFVRMFRALLGASLARHAGADLEALSRMMFLVEEAFRHAGPERAAGGKIVEGKAVVGKAANDRGSLVLGMIEQGLGGVITVEEMARWANLSRGHFARWFGRRMGRSPMRYVRERRMERAKGLLQEQGLTVEEVARRVGYEDRVQFARVFRQVTGEAPGTYGMGGMKRRAKG